jgi:hypothetical protein
MQRGVTYHELTNEELVAEFDQACRRLLDMSGEEFSRRWDSGEFKGSTTAEMMAVLALRPRN